MPLAPTSAAAELAHAPWALLDFGIRCVISEASPTSSRNNNCFKNGILPIKVPKEVIVG